MLLFCFSAQKLSVSFYKSESFSRALFCSFWAPFSVNLSQITFLDFNLSTDRCLLPFTAAHSALLTLILDLIETSQTCQWSAIHSVFKFSCPTARMPYLETCTNGPSELVTQP